LGIVIDPKRTIGGMFRRCRVGSIEIGQTNSAALAPLTIIAGPCVLESLEQSVAIARHVQAIGHKLRLPFIFKGSFDKANRSSLHSPRGPGLERGLDWLAAVRDRVGVPITTDIHEPAQAEPAARIVDLLQIPAFLCRQTDLLLAVGTAAATHRRAVNVKKGQFMAPSEMRGVVKKLAESRATEIMLTDRGTFFGYHRLVNDFVGLADLLEGLDHDAAASTDPALPALPKPLFGTQLPHAPAICFDATHSTQRPGLGEVTGGRPDRALALARAAVAVGVDCLFLECHPDPPNALSDRATVQPLDRVDSFLTSCAAIRRALQP
jgi:2-dehydro-3-deoxyphosphooctonate aldolase (KDO 8-P synthase)